MDRYRQFHKIVTQCNLSSMGSVLNTAMDHLITLFQVDMACYFSVGPKGIQCLAARSGAGADILNPANEMPYDMVAKVASNGASVKMKMPILSGDLSPYGSINKARMGRMLAIPVNRGNTMVGVGYFQRPSYQPDFQQEEMTFMGELLADMELLLENSRLHERQAYELTKLRSHLENAKINMVSKHPSMLKLFNQISKVAKVPTTVLIHGESGTGKELVAKAIYDLSGLKGPYISLNCGGVEANLMKSELFGHRRGSFTGAHADRAGLFQQAEGGILFLDEVGEMPMDMQVALLRTLETGDIRPVGFDREIRVNTRVIAATHRNLKDMVAEGKFRNDLFQRLKGITLHLPPLRERRSDIPLLAIHFLKRFNQKLNQSFKGFTEAAMAKLMALEFRAGNVRELAHLIERAMVFEDDLHYITESFIGEGEQESFDSFDFEEKMAAYGRTLLLEVIDACGGNKTQAMKKLSLPRTTFYSLLHRYGIQGEGT